MNTKARFARALIGTTSRHVFPCLTRNPGKLRERRIKRALPWASGLRAWPEASQT